MTTQDRFAPPPAAPEIEGWTSERVARALVKAFVTLDRLPRARGPREPGGHWPRHAREWGDELAAAELDEAERREREERARRALLRPTGAEISRMDTALEWLRDLRAADAGLALVTTLWALRAARGHSVTALMREKSWAPHTFYRKRAKALEFIARALNARGAAVF
ncbi:hypothetical protein [Methylocella sp.]|uniref:hypothetical protein n=1 Tax=Methylocella sp. TaxID=1978226 RepID=UPI003783FCC6